MVVGVVRWQENLSNHFAENLHHLLPLLVILTTPNPALNLIVRFSYVLHLSHPIRLHAIPLPLLQPLLLLQFRYLIQVTILLHSRHHLLLELAWLRLLLLVTVDLVLFLALQQLLLLLRPHHLQILHLN
jgi:hypothetical protein